MAEVSPDTRAHCGGGAERSEAEGVSRGDDVFAITSPSVVFASLSRHLPRKRGRKNQAG